MPETKIWPSPKVVLIGGGTGTSSVLPGLKKYTDDITAIISVYDNGGSTGRLRKDLDIIAPGDIRACLLALSDNEILSKLLSYRFSEGDLAGHNFGNIFLAAMNEIEGDFALAIRQTGKILNITGRVLPISLQKANLIGELCNGKKIVGESQIPQVSHEQRSRIKRIYTSHNDIRMLDEAFDAVLRADVIILGPGSLYTSVIPNLLALGMVDALRRTKASIVYVSNIMTQFGETEAYSVYDHYKAITDHLGARLVDYIIVNNEKIDDRLIEKYKKESADPLVLSQRERELFSKDGIEIIEAALVRLREDKIRHDGDRLSSLIFKEILG